MMSSHICRGKSTGLLTGVFLLAIFTYLLLYIKLTERNTSKHQMTAYWLQWVAFMESKKYDSAFDILLPSNDSEQFNISVNCLSQNSTTEDLCPRSFTNSGRKTTENGYIPFNQFSYPLEIDMNDLVTKLKTAKNVSVKPIFSYPYTYIKSPTWMCDYRDVRLLILVKSGVSHFKRREMIRYTWGNYTKSGVVTLFLLGSTPHVMFQRRILQEHRRYGDILQMSFFDAYYNNTLKTVGGIKWARNHCNQSKFVLFTDDDFYIATELLLKYIDSMQRFETTSVYRGAMWKNGHPMRSEHNKWYISKTDYPFDHYPDFVAAGFMLLSIDFVIDLDLAIPYTKKFIFDDVYISIVAYKLHVQPSNIKSVHIDKFPYNREGFREIIASHGYDRTSTLQQAWWIHQNRHLHKSGRKSIRAYSVKAT